jgi:hypothetical protein
VYEPQKLYEAVCRRWLGAYSGKHPLSPEDATAKALDYVVNSTVTGSNCANCAQAKGDPKALGCNLFPGKQVSATGWRKVWSKKGLILVANVSQF